MPRLKSGEFTDKEISKLTTLKATKDKSIHTEKLRNLATKWNRAFEAVQGKWYRIHREKKEIAVPSKNAPPVNAMKFEAVDFVPNKKWIGHEEQLAMQKGLDTAITNELSRNNRAIKFPKRLQNVARVYLNKQYAGSVFIFNTIPKDKDNVLLSKRS